MKIKFSVPRWLLCSLSFVAILLISIHLWQRSRVADLYKDDISAVTEPIWLKEDIFVLPHGFTFEARWPEGGYRATTMSVDSTHVLILQVEVLEGDSVRSDQTLAVAFDQTPKGIARVVDYQGRALVAIGGNIFQSLGNAKYSFTEAKPKESD